MIVFYNACRRGDLTTVEQCVKTNIMVGHWCQGMSNACRNGHTEVAKYLIEKGKLAPGWSSAAFNALDAGLSGACEGGYVELVVYLISCGARAFSAGLSFACLYGQFETAKFMVEYVTFDNEVINNNFVTVCRGGYLKIAELLIQHGANRFKKGLSLSCLGGHVELAEFLIIASKDNLITGDLSFYMGYASQKNHIAVVKMLIRHGADNYWKLNTDYFSIYSLFCKYHKINIKTCEQVRENYKKLLKKYPVYQVYLGRIIGLKRKNELNQLRKLPVELIRYLDTFFS